MGFVVVAPPGLPSWCHEPLGWECTCGKVGLQAFGGRLREVVLGWMDATSRTAQGPEGEAQPQAPITTSPAC